MAMKPSWIYKRGDLYLVDLGKRRESLQGGIRPCINIQNNPGNFFSPLLIVLPLTTKLKKTNMPTHHILKGVRGLDDVSMSEAEQPTTISKTQVIKYLGKLDKKQMHIVDETLRIAVGLNDPEDTYPIPECVEFP